MDQLLDRLPAGSRIAVIRLRSLGDCVVTTPALALLKAYRPDLRISVVVEPRFAAAFEHNPDVDEVTQTVPRAKLVLNLHGGTRSMWMTLASGAPYRAGFAHHRYSFLYTHKIPRAQEILAQERRVHTAEHLASAMFWLGVPQTEIPRAKLIAGPLPAYPPYCVIHPFASAVEKAWPVERFLAIAQRLRDQEGLEPMIVGGPGDDTSPFIEFQVFRNAPMAEVKTLLSGASLFLGNDSGPAHIAAAFGVPVVVLFGPSDPATWAPWRTASRVLTDARGMRHISLEQVTAAVEQLKPVMHKVRP